VTRAMSQPCRESVPPFPEWSTQWPRQPLARPTQAPGHRVGGGPPGSDSCLRAVLRAPRDESASGGLRDDGPEPGPAAPPDTAPFSTGGPGSQPLLTIPGPPYAKGDPVAGRSTLRSRLVAVRPACVHCVCGPACRLRKAQTTVSTLCHTVVCTVRIQCPSGASAMPRAMCEGCHDRAEHQEPFRGRTARAPQSVRMPWNIIRLEGHRHAGVEGWHETCLLSRRVLVRASRGTA